VSAPLGTCSPQMTRPSDRMCLRALIVLATIPTPAAAFAIASAYYTLHAAPSRAAAVRCGPRVTIYSVGKTKEAWLQTAIELYTTRLRSVVDIDCVWVRDDAALEAQVSRADSAGCIILDERGPQCTSVEFTSRFFDALEAGGSRVTFFIGGADGLPPALKADPGRLLSLSRLTLTHQMARLLLI
jgi:23S rRNA (pseudouridine1915-N3)-methyltransferase